MKTLWPDGSGERMRVEACDACGRYLKVVAAFSPASPEELALVDLETLPLDYLARGKGYRAWAGPDDLPDDRYGHLAVEATPH